MSLDQRPGTDEYNVYYGTYIDCVPDGPIVATLEREIEDTLALLGGIDEARGDHRYAPGKWSVKEVVGHLIDAERLFSFRAFWISRRDPSPLPGMDPDDWARAAGYDRRTLASIGDELATVRRATVALFRGLDPAAAGARGTASGFEFTVRSLAWIAAGHELHHRRVLAERYLG